MAEPACNRKFFLTPVPATNVSKRSFFIDTTRNAPYVHTQINSILELCKTFPIEVGLWFMIVVFPDHTHIYFFGNQSTAKTTIARNITTFMNKNRKLASSRSMKHTSYICSLFSSLHKTLESDLFFRIRIHITGLCNFVCAFRRIPVVIFKSF